MTDNNPSDFSTEPILESNNNQNDYKSEKKPGKMKWLVPVTAVLLTVIIAASTCFASKTLSNSIALAVLSPEKYYNRVIMKDTSKKIESLAINYKKMLDYNTQILEKGSYTKSSLLIEPSPLITNLIGFDDLKNLELSFDSSTKQGNMEQVISLLCNNKAVTSINLFMNLKEYYYLFQMPDLSGQILKLSLKDEYEKAFENEFSVNPNLANVIHKLPSEKVIKRLLEKYSQIITDGIHTVSISKNKSLTANDVTEKFTLITAAVSDKDMNIILKNILSAAKNDSDLIQIVEDNKIMTKEEFTQNIEDTLAQIEDTLTADSKSSEHSDDSIELNFYVDKKGNIKGRDIIYYPVKNQTNFSRKAAFYTANEQNNIGMHLLITENEIENLSIKGTLNYDSLEDVTGIIDISIINSVDIINFKTDLNIDFKKLSKGEISGNASITSPVFSGIVPKLNFLVKDKYLETSLSLAQDAVNISNIKYKRSILPYKNLNTQLEEKASLDINSPEQFSEYLSNIDIGHFLKTINSRIQIKKINDLLDEASSLFNMGN